MTTESLQSAGRTYKREVSTLACAASTTEETFYPPIRELLNNLLQARKLPFRVRTGTSEERASSGNPDKTANYFPNPQAVRRVFFEEE